MVTLRYTVASAMNPRLGALMIDAHLMTGAKDAAGECQNRRAHRKITCRKYMSTTHQRAHDIERILTVLHLAGTRRYS